MLLYSVLTKEIGGDLTAPSLRVSALLFVIVMQLEENDLCGQGSVKFTCYVCEGLKW